MPGARCTRSLVCAIGSEYAHEYSQRAIGKHPTFPHAMVYGLYRALPGDRLSCHRRLRKICKLDAGVEASGPHDFAVRRQTLSSQAPSASTASRPAFVTFAKRPSVEQDDWGYRLIWVFGKTEYFLKRGWTRNRKARPSGKSVDLSTVEANAKGITHYCSRRDLRPAYEPPPDSRPAD